MKVTFVVDLGIEDDDPAYIQAIQHKCNETVFELVDVPASGDIIDIVDLFEQVNLTKEELEWLIELETNRKVLKVVHKNDDACEVSLVFKGPRAA